MMKLIKALDKEEDAFKFIRNKFPHISDATIQELLMESRCR